MIIERLADQLEDEGWSHRFLGREVYFYHSSNECTTGYEIDRYYPINHNNIEKWLALIVNKVKQWAKYGSLQRMIIPTRLYQREDGKLLRKITYVFRYKPAPLRMMNVLSADILPVDILRHIYSFVIK
jgi:hypothetical protein